MIELVIDPHPLLDLRVFETTFPRPLGELKTPPAALFALFESTPTFPLLRTTHFVKLFALCCGMADFARPAEVNRRPNIS